ncbi:MAG: hypothetical protein GVY19_00030 [Bacteroidetes bacterium]|nr:hypothetical protein [Bacteroidota bacterium]
MGDLAASAQPNLEMIRYKKNEKQIDWIGALWIGWCNAREFILFFLPPHKEKETQPTKQHISQNRTSRTLELIFCEKSCFQSTRQCAPEQ